MGERRLTVSVAYAREGALERARKFVADIVASRGGRLDPEALERVAAKVARSDPAFYPKRFSGRRTPSLQGPARA